MSDDADLFRDDAWDDADPLDSQPDNPPRPPIEDDDGDSFAAHTFDTDQLKRARRGQSFESRWPAIPVLDDDEDDLDDLDAAWQNEPGDSVDADDASRDDEFTAFTVEPQIDQRRRRPPSPAVSAPVQSPASRQQTRSAIQQSARPRRRRREKSPKPPGVWWVTLRSFLIVIVAAMLVSTIFSLWTQPSFFTDEFRAGLNQVQATQRVVNIQPSPLPTETRQIRIGIVAGHTGPPLQEDLPEDPGAVCDDGLTERRINEAVAREVVAALRRDQYTVDLLEEFDTRLEGYQADVLVSIHTNDCQDYGAAGTGFNVASAMARQTTRGQDERLLNCLIVQYGATTGLSQHQGITYDMTEYHTFSEVAVDTPTAIIEIGFMRNDRPLLLNQQPLVAQGIANGIRCFLRPDLYGDVIVQ
jgi:N-acetylmuramoyl-L-alanine amidase